MVTVDMEYSLTCDSCDFSRTVEAEERAYGLARDHEAEQHRHFVLIESVQ